MHRIAIPLLLLCAAPAAAEMGGIEFLRLCKRDPAPCAGIIRERLKDWPKRVLDPGKLRHGRFEHMVCPPHREDGELAGLFVRHAESRGISVRGRSTFEAIDEVFERAFPDCAASRDS